ncbi:MAG: dihydropteroate synthase [Hymenobacteraceae bacterium]|nr:dihydropteroate synthase [Hymenobacteraceae bacterium]
MHSRGTPQTMQSLTNYSAEGGLLVAMLDFFSERIAAARAAGITDLLLDPGFGFAKTGAQNYWLLSRLPDLQAVLQLPWLVGLSRKGMTYRPAGLGPAPADALPATTALHALALWHGAAILRVHDVAEARQAVIVARLTRAAADAAEPAL